MTTATDVERSILFGTDHLTSPIAVDPATGEAHLRVGDTVDALIMRAGLGAEVNNLLTQAMFEVPIIALGTEGKPDSWIFLTLPRTQMRDRTVADLLSKQVSWHKVGTTIPLPSLGRPLPRLRWAQPPRAGKQLVSWGTVVGAVRRTSSWMW